MTAAHRPVDDLLLEPAAPADLEELLALETNSFPEPWNRRMLAEEIERQDGLFLTVRRIPGGALLAAACWRRSAATAELLRLAVAPGQRRRGIARRLIAGGLEVLAAGGCLHCVLEVRADNGPALAAYRALGFRPVGERPRYYRDGSAAILFERRLEPPAHGSSAP